MAECEKRGYTNEHAARRANKAMGNTIRPYRCEECGKIHVTKERYNRAWSRPQKRRKA